MKTLISLLGGYIVKEGDLWRSSDLNVLEGASLRVNAAASLLNTHQEATVLLQGGLADAFHPSLASVLEQELLDLGILKERMIIEEKSQKTFQQLLELQNFVIKNHPSSIEILSNDWHLPRIEAMVNYVPELAALLALSPTYVAAEEVLTTEDPQKWLPMILATRLLTEMQKVIVLEKKGTEQILEGTYKFC